MIIIISLADLQVLWAQTFLYNQTPGGLEMPPQNIVYKIELPVNAIISSLRATVNTSRESLHDCIG